MLWVEAVWSPRLRLHDKFYQEHFHVRRDAFLLASALEAFGNAQNAPAVVLSCVVLLLARVDYTNHLVF